MPKPDKYPLPWCEAVDLPYWRINIWCCLHLDGWREWQAGKSMSEIIPRIDEVIGSATPVITAMKEYSSSTRH